MTSSTTAPGPGALPAGPVVLDVSFVIALLEEDEAAARFTAVLPRAVLPSVTAGKVFHKLAAGAGMQPGAIEDGLIALGVKLVDLPVLTGDRHWTTLAPHGLPVPVHHFRDFD